MKYLKRLLVFSITLFIAILKVSATSNLTISNKNYDENTNVFTISGTSNYDEVMVSLFDGEELLSFKTVSTHNNNYDVTFNISFSEDKSITIKVGDINSTDYKISTLNVKKSVAPVKPNKITDNNGNSLTLMDSLKKFEFDDELQLDLIDDFEGADEDTKNALSTLKEKLGVKRKFTAIMFVGVHDDREDKRYEDSKEGFKLFINIDEKELKDYKKPFVMRLLDDHTLEFEDPIRVTYDKEAGGIVLLLNNIGTYVIYDDISIDYKFLDDTENPTYNLKKGEELTLRINADFSKFLAVYMDGKLVDSKNYKAKSGSTIITFSKEYMNTLAVGTHKVKVDFTDGEANTEITITNKNSVLENVISPQTGDKIIKYVTLSFVSLLGIVGVIYLKKKKLD